MVVRALASFGLQHQQKWVLLYAVISCDSDEQKKTILLIAEHTMVMGLFYSFAGGGKKKCSSPL